MGYLTRMLIEKKWRENGRKDALRLARQPRPEGVAVETGLAYLPDGDPMHTLNLYRPEGPGALCPRWWTSTGAAGCTGTGS